MIKNHFYFSPGLRIGVYLLCHIIWRAHSLALYFHDYIARTDVSVRRDAVGIDIGDDYALDTIIYFVMFARIGIEQRERKSKLRDFRFSVFTGGFDGAFSCCNCF